MTFITVKLYWRDAEVSIKLGVFFNSNHLPFTRRCHWCDVGTGKAMIDRDNTADVPCLATMMEFVLYSSLGEPEKYTIYMYASSKMSKVRGICSESTDR